MKRKFIDLSVSLQEGIKSDPDFMLPKINYHHHNETAEEMISFFPGLKKDNLPGGEGWAMETITVSTHNGTHMDAPYHYHSTMDNGKRAITIDEVPLEWCFNKGIKLDLRSYDDGYVLTKSDIKYELNKINYSINPLDIVFINTSAGDRYGEDDFLSKGCGIGRDATIFLLDQGVRLTGTDAWSWDAPFIHTAKKFEESKDASLIWEGHRAGMVTGYSHIEKLTNLDQLPDHGFTVSAFPFKIKHGSAGFVRVVAILD
ncbi:cyclase family protein [Alphaproteobacteria bacterium]|jgi:kynurenine formamidase|nr:cyclase family protein [Alphaproteobacteria bacterium]|tara:strand:- start:1255 stop:2028 length:774 start_codon:yes stop_codon:yes gene_type:complete